ncbi:uncharacterized phosphotransferase YvkC-like isoform X2 [Mya arenaria]|uniref:uncharacterized phosphotransferase YvkC-like isoform X2 n=2 Tax=Mya arenaria TaxID=6604 RepID=UPI0022E7AFD8|nr:uncharacterized phosphotransferase YvkC-like isoform X2 [Mya arenaria]XP_052812988.1 uncharacterized phosphotransferase YvkC-like isoform X2 [Mya arenaria]
MGYRAAGCRFTVIEPMRSWRVTYNGLLRLGLHCEPESPKPKNLLNVKLSFKWECVCDPFNFDVDLCHDLLAEAVAKETWNKEFWDKLRGKHQTHYEQCGELSGTIEVEGHKPQRVFLKSFRDHTFGVRNWEMFERYAVHYIWIEEVGIMAMVASLWMPGYITRLKSGYLMYANGVTYPVTAVNFDLEGVTRERNPPEKYSFTFEAADIVYHVDVIAVVTPEVYHYTTRTSRVLERFSTYTVNGKPARGLTEYHYRNPEGPPMSTTPEQSVPLLREPALSDLSAGQGRAHSLSFTDKACKSSFVVGGKGAQLALLTAIQREVNAEVPKGFCLTLDSFEMQLLENTEIVQSIERIVESIRLKNIDNLQELCSDAVRLLATCKVCEPIESELTSQLESVFGAKSEAIRLAVRSSAAGEDGGESSSAGQMETCLGVKGLEGILKAIMKCWASAYTFQAVEYRRQHGQPVRTSVGVVVQEMVAAESAGVIFTNDPVSGNPNRIVLDACFGLGEAVVSGKTTPDTFIIQHYPDNTLNILERRIGNKNLKVYLLGSGGTLEVESDNAGESCLSDGQIIQLASTAIQIEKYFGSARDIEWAIVGDKVYLLQARPVTTCDQDTDEDLIHEFDTPVMTDRERITIGNIGEMMPGCVTPLTSSIFGRAVDRACSVVGSDFGGSQTMTNASKLTISNCGRLFINLTYTAHIYSNSVIYKKEALEMNLVGTTLEDHTLEIIESQGRVCGSFMKKLMNAVNFFSVSSHKIKIANGWLDKLKGYQVGERCKRSAELYKAITEQLPDYYEVWETTIHKSGRSGSFGGIVMGIVSGGKDEWSMDNYSDVALLLSQCDNVYSAEVPMAMKEIASCIVDCKLVKEFLEISESECVDLLTSPDSPAPLREKYTTFLQRHGHRCVREAELMEKSWREEPEKFIRVIKVILKSNAYLDIRTEGPSIEEAVNRLKSPVSWFGCFLLKKWIVKKARDAVGNREFGKSIAVELSDRFKQAYWRLADMLFMEGLLPDRELMFFLRHIEIGQLIETCSARLVTKAVRRRRILPVQNEMNFPRICVGRPTPIQVQEEEERKPTFTLKGMPVSQGSVQGRARVVKSLHDADQIEKGDVLIVSYTDVGWSPYFPLIAGLATELGGLVSHGAVVAREYGLPCVVNVPDATHAFHSGDYVHLDGTNGAIHRLEQLNH